MEINSFHCNIKVTRVMVKKLEITERAVPGRTFMLRRAGPTKMALIPQPIEERIAKRIPKFTDSLPGK